MLKTKLRKSIILFLAAILAVVSGCVSKNEPAAINTEKNNEIASSTQVTGDEETATSSSEIVETATSTEEIGTSDWLVYRNDFYNFSLDFSKEYKYCLDDFCSADTKDNNILYFAFTNYPQFEQEIFEILPRKNLLNISAIELGKEIMLQNEKQNQYVQNSGKEIIFAGENAYSFDVKNSFNEDGLIVSSYDYRGEIIQGVKRGNGHFGILLDSPHKVIYFEKNNILFRIIYPLNDVKIGKIISTFKFID